MESKWRKVKLALGMKMCLFVPKTLEDSPPESAVVLSPAPPPPPLDRSSYGLLDMLATPVPSSSGLLRLPNYSLKSSKNACAICLNTMKLGQGHAIFTAECSHAFHFQCITLNVKHGNDVCPVCRAKWKEVPFQSPTADLACRRSSSSTSPYLSGSQGDPWTTMVRRFPHRLNTNRNLSSSYNVEPDVFNDDEPLDHQPEPLHSHSNGAVEVKTYTEVPAVSISDFYRNFTVLIHLKAPRSTSLENSRTDGADLSLGYQNSKVPVDLVTVLDVSGSMAGTKLSLLKRAMGFVIQNLGPTDRLSVIAFSSSSHRLFPLRKMSENGKREALRAVNSLISNGGTNISEALKQGAKVMSDRTSKNPVSSIILLSDGQDTYCSSNSSGAVSLLPVSLHRGGAGGPHIPVHVFGFGADHDVASMHSISETSGGTFSFIEAEAMIQDAFAQCIGGLLSVVVQELVLHVQCVHPKLQLSSIKAGSYRNHLNSNGRIGIIEVGDLYADEERDFLVSLDVPPAESDDETTLLLNVSCFYKDPISKKLVTFDDAANAKIQRPKRTTRPMSVSMEVDKQRNRIQTAVAMLQAKAAADNGDLAAAVSVLGNCRRKLAESVSLKAGNRLCVALDAELMEMQERMGNRQIYETSGRAYVLSGLSSHSWQRATARGDSTESTSMLHAYQTPSMVDMVHRSQTMSMDGPIPVRPTGSFQMQPQPRWR